MRRAGALAAALLVAALPAARAEESAVMADPVVGLSFSLGYIATDLGLFEKHGVKLKTVQITGVGALNAVISGSAEFAQPSGASLTRAAARGQRLLAIVGTLDRDSIEVVLRKTVAAAAGFDPKAPLAERAKLLRGRTIAIDSVNSLIHAYVRLIAKRAGYDPEDIHLAVMQPPSMLAAFAAGQIDGYAMGPPWPQKAVLDGTGVAIASGFAGDPPDMVPLANTVVVTRPETCAKRKALCAGVGAAFTAAAAFVKAEPDKALALLAKRFPNLDPKLLAYSFALVRGITPSPPAVTLQGLENDEKLNVDAGLLAPEDALKSYDGLFTDAYLH